MFKVPHQGSRGVDGGNVCVGLCGGDKESKELSRQGRELLGVLCLSLCGEKKVHESLCVEEDRSHAG